MEIKYSPVTYADRLSFLSEKKLIKDVEAQKVPWEIIIGLTVIGVITTIMIIDYQKNKLKEEI